MVQHLWVRVAAEYLITTHRLHHHHHYHHSLLHYCASSCPSNFCLLRSVRCSSWFEVSKKPSDEYLTQAGHGIVSVGRCEGSSLTCCKSFQNTSFFFSLFFFCLVIWALSSSCCNFVFVLTSCHPPFSETKVFFSSAAKVSQTFFLDLTLSSVSVTFRPTSLLLFPYLRPFFSSRHQHSILTSIIAFLSSLLFPDVLFLLSSSYFRGITSSSSSHSYFIPTTS